MLRHAGWTLGLLVVVALASAGPAAADGYCGPDPTSATACPFTTNATLNGAISSGSEQDYYVFYVAHQTDLQLTVADTEDARCSNQYPTYPYICGWAEARLLNKKGDSLADTGVSNPNNGVTVPQTVSKTIPRGTYYVDVSAYQGSGTLPSIAYQVTVNGNPGVQWPPACIVPRVRAHTRLGRAKHMVANHRCAVGAVHYVSSRRTPRGDVIRLKPGAHSILPFAAPVAIYVSGQPRHHRRHHRHRRHHK